MPGKFEVYEDAAGKFRFRLKASNGEVVASSNGTLGPGGWPHFSSKAAARKGCEAVIQAADGAPVVEVER